MKKNIKKIVIGIIILSIIGIGAYAFFNKEESTIPEVEVTETIESVEEVIVPEETEIVEPEVIEEETIEAIEIVENTETKPEGKTLNVYDAKKFLEENKTFDTVTVSAKGTESEVETPVIETEVVESVEEPEVSEIMSNNELIETTVVSVDVDFSTSSNLQAIKLSADEQIHAECGGGNEYTGFILTPDTVYISYFGAIADNICTVRKNENTVTLTINAELNDLAWNCMSAALSEIFPNGATLASACRKDCENGTGGYAAENQWVVIDGVATTVNVLDPEEAGAANLGSIIYTFKR